MDWRGVDRFAKGWIRRVIGRSVAAGVLLVCAGVVVSCDGGMVGGSGAGTPTAVVANAVPAIPEPTPTVDLEGARERFEAGGELSFEEIGALKLEIVGNQEDIDDIKFAGERARAQKEYDKRLVEFGLGLEKCRLKEMVGWIGWWYPSLDDKYMPIADSYEVALYTYDVFKDETADAAGWPEITLENMTDKQVGEMKYGQRMKVSGRPGLENGYVLVNEPVYSLLDDEVVGDEPTPEELKGLRVTLVRTSCFGLCPDYELVVGENGVVSFDGRLHTKVAGRASGVVDREKVVQLVREIKKARFFELKDAYQASVTDNPTYTLRVEMDGKDKLVSCYVACPPKLFILMDRVDQSADSEQWVGDGK